MPLPPPLPENNHASTTLSASRNYTDTSTTLSDLGGGNHADDADAHRTTLGIKPLKIRKGGCHAATRGLLDLLGLV